MKYYASPEVQKNLDLLAGTNDLKSVNSPEKIANKTTSLALSVREKDHQPDCSFGDNNESKSDHFGKR